MFKKRINGHEKKILKEHHAGRYVSNPQQLPDGCHVTVFEIGSKNWWEHGELYTKRDGTKAIDCGDGDYQLNQVEVYLDTCYACNI